MPEPAPPSSRRILLIRPSALGDVCRTVPVLVSLKRAYPTAEIEWLVQDDFAPAIRAHPDLARVVPFPRKRFGRWWYPPIARELLAWLRSLHDADYDLVLDCQGLARSAVFARATRATRRIGYRQAAELGWLGLTDRVDVPTHLHTVDRMLALAKAAGASPVRDMRLYPPPSDLDAVVADPDLAGLRYAVVAPTSRWPGKRWPAERFAGAIEQLLADRRCSLDRVVLVGAPSERDQCGPLLDLAVREPRVLDRIGRTSIGGLLALISRSSLVIANDSAALHMAVGCDRPLVALYGPTRVNLVGPYGRPHTVLQRVTAADDLDHKDDAAGRALMERIPVEDLLRLAREQLDAAAAPIAPAQPAGAA